MTLAFPESPEEIIFTIPLCGYKTHVCISSISFAPTFQGEDGSLRNSNQDMGSWCKESVPDLKKKYRKRRVKKCKTE